jgi:hypothetical protein
MEPSHEGESIAKAEEFRQEYGRELEELLESGLFDNEPLPPDPSSMGLGEINLEELSDEQILIVRETVFTTLGVNPIDETATHRTYQAEAPQEATVPGQIDIKVFRTNREGTFLQEMTYQDGKQRWVIGSDTNI